MEILRDYSQIVNKTKQALDIDISQTPFLDVLPDYDLEFLAEKSNISTESYQICNLAELIFQLNDYVPALCNYIKLFLYKKEYDAVYYFLSKIFASHIGAISYVSKADRYTFEQRYFDRFIEVVKNAKIDLEQYLPLVLDAISKQNLKIHVWEQPALEYMQNLIRENEDEVADYVLQNDEYELEFIKLILQFNTQKGISLLFNNRYVQRIGEQNAEFFLKQYIKDTLNFFDKNLENAGNNRFHYIKVLASITNNTEIESRLKDVFEDETDAEIKEYLSKRLGISIKTSFGSDKHFRVLAQKKVTEVQQRSLGCAFENMPLRFLDGEMADNVSKTYLINIFKEETNLQNLYGLTSLYEVFNRQDLVLFANKLFDRLIKKDDINSAKWCVRMCALFSENMFERIIYEFLIVLYKLGRKKEAYYLTECLLYSKKQSFLEVFVRLRENNLFKQMEEEFISIYSKQCQISPSHVKDLLVPEVLDEQQTQAEIERLYWGFIAGRKYTYETFNKLFIHHSVFNSFAQRLVFGEYKQGKLYSLFKVNGTQIEYIFGGRLSNEDAEPYISIAHSLDLDERFEKTIIYNPNPLFEQFPKFNFDVKNFERTSISVSNLEGMLVNGQTFAKNMQQKMFRPNANPEDAMFGSLIQTMPLINLLAQVEFEKPISTQTQTATLGQIRFYHLNSVMKDRDVYITNKANSISVGSLPERYFEYVLDSVYNSIKGIR